MDAIILYLPSPKERNKLFSNFDEELCAKAFKVIHDKQRGPLVFFRIYNGILKKGQRIYSVQQNLSEQLSRLYIAYADDFKEVDVVSNGNIAVAGLKVRFFFFYLLITIHLSLSENEFWRFGVFISNSYSES